MDRKNRSIYGRLMPRAVVVGVACLLALCLTVRAQLLPGSSPGDQVDMVFKDFNKPDSPGCAVAVIKAGSIIYKRGYGMADLDRSIKITPTTVFHAASLTKQFTAMSIMLLVKGGQLKLDDPVDKYIAVPVARRPDGTQMTIGDILSHLSGIRDQWVLFTMAGKHLYEDVVTQEYVLNLVSRMKSVDFEPGEDFLYSNTGFTLAGLIVKKVTGQSLSEFAHENIFQKLGMNDTMIINKHDEAPQNHAFGYTEKAPFQLWMPKLDVPGSTNLYTTVEDLARWDRNFDDKTVGGDAVLSQMQTAVKYTRGPSRGQMAQLGKDDNNNVVHYGLGLELTEHRQLKVVEHDGRDAGYRAHLIRFPDQHFAVACLCNLALPEDNQPRKLARQVADIYLGLGPAPPSQPAAVPPTTPSAPLTPADLAKFTGQYYSEEVDTIYHVVPQGSSLVIRRQNYEDTPLKPASVIGGIFTIEAFGRPITNGNAGRPLTHGTVSFTSAAGRITGLRLSGRRFNLDRIFNFELTKMP